MSEKTTDVPERPAERNRAEALERALRLCDELLVLLAEASPVPVAREFAPARARSTRAI